MSKAIMLLPYVDLLQLGNCHKYVTRTDSKRYDEIYTLTTIAGQCKGMEKILVIGHGDLGKFVGATPDQVADAIMASGISQTDGKKIAFDCCYAGAPNTQSTNTSSALELLSKALTSRNKDCKFTLVGATGCTVTIGGDKRLVISAKGYSHAEQQQVALIKQKNVNPGKVIKVETRDSSTLKQLARFAYEQLKDFAIEFRGTINADIDSGEGRKVHIQVG